MSTSEGLTAAVDEIAHAHLAKHGPGLAVAVLRDNDVRHRAGYGLANVAQQVPMTPSTAFRICSVTKQFTCALVRMLAAEGRIDLSASPRQYLPQLDPCMERLTVRQLAQNVSGLRDYWCVAMLTGAEAETVFNREDAERLLLGPQGFQFEPGTAYSYNNGNFALLGWIVEAVTGERYPDVLRERILEPLGMSATFVPQNTADPLPGGSTGYEPVPGDSTGSALQPTVVNIHWEGDAGIVSTLDDLTRWERNFETDSLGGGDFIKGLFETPVFPRGVQSGYGFGLNLGRYRGFALQTHEGGLRGWRMCRLRFPTERLSVIVLLNHLADAGVLARRIADLVLPGERLGPQPPARATAAQKRLGFYLDRATGKGYELRDARGTLQLNAMGSSLALIADGEDSFVTSAGARISFAPDDSRHGELRIPGLNYAATLERLRPGGHHDPSRYTGAFKNEGLDATMTLESVDGALTVRIDGPLGQASGWPLRIVSDDVLVMACQRSLDYQPPGEFVLWFQRDADGRPEALIASCTLAYGLRFSRL